MNWTQRGPGEAIRARCCGFLSERCSEPELHADHHWGRDLHCDGGLRELTDEEARALYSARHGRLVILLRQHHAGVNDAGKKLLGRVTAAAAVAAQGWF